MEITWWHEALRLLTSTQLQEGTTLTITHEGRSHTLTLLSWHPSTGLLTCLVDNKPYRWQLRCPLSCDCWQWYSLTDRTTITLHRRPAHKKKKAAVQEFTPELYSPLGGTVLRVLVAPGDFVTNGTPLLIIESMKMENEIRAPQNCFIQTLCVRANDVVNPDQQLIVFAKKGAENGPKSTPNE